MGFGTKLFEKPRVPNKRSTMGALGTSGLGSREFVAKSTGLDSEI